MPGPDRGPSTRELITDAEKLRSGAKGKLPKTRQLVRESEKLIGREGSSSSKGVLFAVLFVSLGLAAAAAYWFLF